jgi:leader peptidase (prepilin peptidase)/N-methyltransferase
MIRIFATVFGGLLGLAFGSFLNVCLSRWPEDESVVLPRSHCRNCEHVLSWWENLPLLSWLVLRGRCRQCRSRIGWRYPLIELAVGALWASVGWTTPIRPEQLEVSTPALCSILACVVGMLVFYWLMVGLAVLDAENLWLPDWLTLPGTALGFLQYLATIFMYRGMEPDVNPASPWTAILGRLLGIFAAAALILVIRWSYWLVRHREGIGLGDAKLMALLAAWLGFPQAILAFCVAVVLGALSAILLLAIPPLRMPSEGWAVSKLPLGTFLCIGGIVSSLWGPPLLAVYLNWAGF